MRKDLEVVFTDDPSHVIHAAVYSYNLDSVETLVQDTRCGEVLAMQLGPGIRVRCLSQHFY